MLREAWTRGHTHQDSEEMMEMEGSRYDLSELLDHIDPVQLDYQSWVDIGMALQYEGYGVEVWDAFSRRDPGRWHRGECQRKWGSFCKDAHTPVTGGTIVQIAREQGWAPPRDLGQDLGWGDTISREGDGPIVVDRDWVERREIREPEDWHPEKELITYIDTLFGTDDIVGYVTRSWSKPDDDKKYPDKGCWDRTARQLIQKLSACKGDIGSVLGDYDPEVGAWIRFNPLDGRGCKNENVAEYRYALVESDATDLGQQYAIIRELEFPVACLVHSGKKSLHAIVRVEASSYEEYKKRVDYLYKVCEKNGLKVDRQNKNPSRLSRMPGVIRGGKKQFLIDTNIGKASWDEWKEWIEGIDDDLPDIQNISTVKEARPPLAPELLKGVLRSGHKLLLTGASKASKSFALIEMAIAIAEGTEWMGFRCARGKVLYVNLELDTNSCWNRILDVYAALHLDISDNIDVWNLRGRSVPMDKLAPKLIRRAGKKDYTAIIIDPIYKVLTGDENAADQMAKFCNQFDLVCTELGCSVIYCHHHSKGGQGGKRSMDRASGSGVFARDPDALLDMIELELTEDILKQQEDKAVCAACEQYLEEMVPGWRGDLSQDDLCSSYQMLAYCEDKLGKRQFQTLQGHLEKARARVRQMTALRIEGTLREFPKFAPVNIWFDYPIHKVDEVGILADVDLDDPGPAYKKNFNKRKTGEEKEKEDKEKMEQAFTSLTSLSGKNTVTVSEMMEYLNIKDPRTFAKRLKRHGGFEASNLKENGVVFRL